jgi:DNA-directed RNA polymerase specialized sigma24 family protein
MLNSDERPRPYYFPVVAIAPHHARRLEEARRGLMKAMRGRDEAITQAWLDGASLREIAQAVGMTHSGVSRLLNRAGMRQDEGFTSPAPPAPRTPQGP